jgi:hypothetical protein
MLAHAASTTADAAASQNFALLYPIACDIPGTLPRNFCF